MWVLLQRRRLGRRQLSKRQDGAELLPLQGQRSSQAGSPGSTAPPVGFTAAMRPAFPGLQRRARVARLLRQALQSQGGMVEMLPLHSVQAGLAHRISQPSSSGAAAPSAGGMEQEPLLLSWASGQEWAEAWAAGSASSHSSRELPDSRSSGGSGSTGGASRRWGLETESLRLLPGELEVRRDEGWRLLPGCDFWGEGQSSWVQGSLVAEHALEPQMWFAHPPMLLAAPALQIVAGTDGQPVVLGEGSHAVVMLGRLQGIDVAVKARAAAGAPCAASAAAACGGSFGCNAAPVTPTGTCVMHSSPQPNGRLPQVYELGPGARSQRMWHEAALLRSCAHPRLVPLYGAAVSVRGCCAGCRPIHAVLPLLAYACPARSSRAVPPWLRQTVACDPMLSCRWRCILPPHGLTCLLRPEAGALHAVPPASLGATRAAPRLLQGQLMLLVQHLMRGGSLQAALQDAGQREALRWSAW